MASLAEIQALVQQIKNDLPLLVARSQITPSQIVVGEGLSDVSERLGLVQAGEFRTGNGVEPGFGFSGVRIGYPAFVYNSDLWNFAGVNADVLQLGINSDDGRLYFGAGSGVLNSGGIEIEATGLFINSNGYKFVDEFDDIAGGVYAIVRHDVDDVAIRLRAQPEDGLAFQSVLASVDAVGTFTALSRLTVDSGSYAGAASEFKLFQNAAGGWIDVLEVSHINFNDAELRDVGDLTAGNGIFIVDTAEGRVEIGTDHYIPISTAADPRILFNFNQADMDFIVATAISASTLYVDGGIGSVGINTVPQATLDVDGGALFNKSAANKDFVVYGTSGPVAWVDGSEDRLSIGFDHFFPTQLAANPNGFWNEQNADMDFTFEGLSGINLISDAGLDAIGIGGVAESGYKLKVHGKVNLTTGNTYDISGSPHTHSADLEWGGSDELNIRNLLFQYYPYYFKHWDNTDGYTVSNTGSGSFPAGTVHTNPTTGATNGSRVCVFANTQVAMIQNSGFLCNFKTRLNPSTAMSSSTVWVGMLSNPTSPGSTDHHAAFKIVDGSIFASTGNGSSGTLTDTGIDVGQFQVVNLMIQEKVGSIDFIVENTSLGTSATTTITTTLPNSGTTLKMTFNMTNATAAARTLALFPFLYITGVIE